MKPRGQQEQPAEPVNGTAKTTTSKSTAGATPTKKKQPSSTSVAGRKIARKTAHSLIERRRRSKMNEEFGVLKSMIPACTGEMHKLAILQASIDYVRYLEDCVAKLKAQNNRSTPTPTSAQDFSLLPAVQGAFQPNQRFNDYEEDDEDEDIEMGGSEATSPVYMAATPRSHQPSISPAIIPQDSRDRQNSYSSASTDQRHYSYSASSTTSPAFGPQGYAYARSTASAGSALTSPALLPQRDLDQEATAALLMLNSDRRGTNASANGRGGMSVKDLLST